MDYIKILKRAWEITWRHKALWLFGFLLALFGAGGGGGHGMRFATGPGDRVGPAFVLTIVFVILFLALVWIVVGIILSTLSHGALIGMVHEIEETGNTNVRSGWRIGWSRFLLLFVIDLVIGIPAAIVAFILIALGLSPLLLLFAQRSVLTVLAIALTVLFMLLVIGLLIIMGVVLSLLRKLAYRQCVLERKGVLDSIRDGYLMGRQNLRHVGVVWLLLFGIDLLIGIVAVPLFFTVFAAAATPGILTYLVSEAWAPTLLVSAPLIVLAILLMTLLAGVYQVFRSAVWTLTYLQL